MQKTLLFLRVSHLVQQDLEIYYLRDIGVDLAMILVMRKSCRFFLLLSFLFVIPQAFVTELWQLIICRLLFGIAVGGMIPITTALIRRDAPINIQGEMMGYNTSFRFLGNIIGPMFGGIVSGFIGISSVFIVTSSLISCWVYFPLSC